MADFRLTALKLHYGTLDPRTHCEKINGRESGRQRYNLVDCESRTMVKETGICAHYLLDEMPNQ